jgi:uncharacterized protein with HEPN domain
MHPKSPKWLDDIADASGFILQVTAGVSLADYQADRVLRAVVERNFEIVGEAILRLERTDPATVRRISDYRRIIGLRNRLVHGYDAIDHRLIWEIIHQFLPVLKAEVGELLREAEGETPAGA